MKITIDFENGMQVNLKPENIQLVDIKTPAGELAIAVGFKTDVAQVPFLFFPGLQLATKEELAQRPDALKAAAAEAAYDAAKALSADGPEAGV